MRQVYHNLCTYSADLFGINSALYELGGLIVMHDASGCNSTYNTHDEPRWYTMDSMVYVSGLNEKDAILGNDQKIIDDICAVAEKEHPKFIVLSLSVLPAYMGTDVKGIMRLIEKRTGIPSFGFATNGMDTYVRGAGMAFRAIAERFCPAKEKNLSVHPGEKDAVSVNLLGVTPLDFSVNGNVEALEQTIIEMGFTIQSNWAMGCTLETLKKAPEADVNLVVSVTGLQAAEYFFETFGIPYVIGLPCGAKAIGAMREKILNAVRSKTCGSLFDTAPPVNSDDKQYRLIGEPVHCASIRYYLENELGAADVKILCPMEEDGGILRESDVHATGEEAIEAFLNSGSAVIGDPVYRRVVKPDITFIDDPHDAYSGRMYHDRGWVFTGRQIAETIR
ncbi:MAG: oxidoreductase [Lachnospiraceae bacterium]|nr:oxidoreductase [Lachnospiraceae bacterium]